MVIAFHYRKVQIIPVVSIVLIVSVVISLHQSLSLFSVMIYNSKYPKSKDLIICKIFSVLFWFLNFTILLRVLVLLVLLKK